MMVVAGSSRSCLLILLLFFCHGRVASSSTSPVEEEDDSVIPVFEAVTDLVAKISTAKGWDLNRVHILDIDSEDAKFTKAVVYELDIQIGDRVLPAKFIDEATDWQRLVDEDISAQPANDDRRGSWKAKSLQTVLEPFQLNGPLDFSFQSLEPSLSSSEVKKDFSHWKEVRLAVGSSVEVSGAQEISLAHPIELSFPVNKSSPIKSLVASIMFLAARAQNVRLQQDRDSLQLSLQISGPSLVASIKGFNISSHDLSAKSLKVFYKEETEHNDGEAFLALTDFIMRPADSILPFPILNSSDPRFSLLEEMMKLYLGYGYEDYFTILNAKVAASTYILFEFEIERELDEDDFDPVVWPEWKTRPTTRKYAFQVLAKVRNNALIPITVQTVKRYKTVETYALRDLTANISYSSFSTFLGIPSPMTLDVY